MGTKKQNKPKQIYKEGEDIFTVMEKNRPDLKAMGDFFKWIAGEK